MKLNSRLAMLLASTLIVSSVPMTAVASDFEGHWAQPAIEEWKDKGVLNGYEDGSFKPSKAITKAEFAQILVNVFGYTETKGAKVYTDVDENAWYSDAIAKVSAAKVMYEEGEKFNPNQNITREEAAYAFANAYKLNGKATITFKDEASISDWALEKVNSLLASGGIKGTPEGNFNPKSSLTRAEAICMLNNINAELINKKGTYSKDVEGNLVVNVRDVVLKDMVIKGNLYLAEGIGDGDIDLENVKVEGQVFIEGGGINSIRSRNCEYQKQLVVSAKNPVRVVIQGEGVKIEALAGTNVTLAGSFKAVTVSNDVNMVIKDAKVEELVIADTQKEEGKAPVITIDKQSTVETVQVDIKAEIKGEGKISELIVSASNVKVEQKPEKTTVSEGVKDVNVAGTVQNPSSNKNDKEEKPNTSNGSTSSGGSNSSGSSSSNSVKPYYTISGTLKAVRLGEKEAELVQGGSVKVYESKQGEWKYVSDAQTDEEGKYSLTLPSKKDYVIEAWVEDEENNGYYVQQEIKSLKSNYSNYELVMQQFPVANIKIVNKNGKPMNNVKVVAVRNGKEEDYRYSDRKGHSIYYLWGDETTEYSFKFYMGKHEVKPVEAFETIVKKDVMEKDHYRKDITVQLPVGLESRLEGQLLMPDGLPASDVYVQLELDTPGENGGMRDCVDGVRTNEDGTFLFENIDTNISDDQYYVLNIIHRDAEGVSYDADDSALTFEAIQAAGGIINLQKTYGAIIQVVDKNDQPITNAYVRLTGSNQYGPYSIGAASDREGKTDISAIFIEPGVHAVEVRYGNEVMIEKLDIKEGQYFNEMTIKFEKVDINNRATSIEVKGDTVRIGKETFMPAYVCVEGWMNNETKEYRFDINNGIADIEIPQALNVSRISVYSEEGVRLYLNYRLEDGMPNVIDLTNVQSFNLSGTTKRVDRSGELSQVTTGSVLHLSLKTDIEHENIDLGTCEVDEEGNYAFEGIDLIPGSWYVITGKDGDEYIVRSWTSASNPYEAEFPLTFKPLENVDFYFELEDGTVVSDAKVLFSFFKEEINENGHSIVLMGNGDYVDPKEIIVLKDGKTYECVNAYNNGQMIGSYIDIESKMVIKIVLRASNNYSYRNAIVYKNR